MKHETYWKSGKNMSNIGNYWKTMERHLKKHWEKIGKHIGELFETTNPPSPAATRPVPGVSRLAWDTKHRQIHIFK